MSSTPQDRHTLSIPPAGHLDGEVSNSGAPHGHGDHNSHPAPAKAYVSAKWARPKARNELGEGTLLQVKCFRLMEQHLFKPYTFMWVNIFSERPAAMAR